MKVLWFTPLSSLYEQKIGNSYNGGGWISSLEYKLKSQNDIELAVAFEHKDSVFKKQIENVLYYPINKLKTKINKIKKLIGYIFGNITFIEKNIIRESLKIINDFKPDIIHIFGSEASYFGLIQEHTKVPCIVHIQGSWPAYINAKPSGKSFFGIRHLFIDSRIHRYSVKREERILRMTKNFMGRTEWDMSIANLYAPNSRYFHCDEILRNIFIENMTEWQAKNRDKIILLTVGGGAYYKGLDIVKKTEKLLLHLGYNIEWRLVGVSPIGVLDAEQLKCEFLNTDVYVHPSYIDNSPNALCEAQILGVPCIASFVGGIPSLIENGKTGLLFGVNDIYMLASQIIKIAKDKDFAKMLGDNAKKVALKRHNPEKIVKRVIEIYEKVGTNRSL